MDFEMENQRQEMEYGRALERIPESLRFWKAIGSGEPVLISTAEVLSENWPPPTPDEAYREAMNIVDRWRDFRAAHDRP